MKHCLNITKPSILILDESFDSISPPRTIPIIITGGKSKKSHLQHSSLHSLLEKQQKHSLNFLLSPSPDFECTPEDPAVILFTSGTTSLPKAVMSSQRAFLGNYFNSTYSFFRACLREGTPIDLENPSPWPKAGDPQRVALVASPLFHVVGCNSNLV